MLVGMSIATTSYAASNPDKSTGYLHEVSALISNIRVIDGLGHAPVDAQDILVVAGKIAAIGNTGTIDAPDGALTIDGNDKNLKLVVNYTYMGFVGYILLALVVTIISSFLLPYMVSSAYHDASKYVVWIRF